MSSAVLAMRERILSFLGRGTDASNPLRARPAGGPDRLFCAVVLLLCALGLVMVFSAGAGFAARRHGDWTYFLRRDSIYLAIGLVGFFVAMQIDYGAYRRWGYPLLFVAIGLLMGLLFFGTQVKGAVRWYRFGALSFQPSELAKFALVLYLSLLLSRNVDRVKAFSMGFLPPVIMTGVVVGLIIIQPDLGTGVILGLTALGLLFISGTRMSYIAAAILIAAPVVWKVLIMGKEWRLKRLLVFLEPWKYCQSEGYQLCESLISVGSGSVFGQGLGQSRQKLLFLPEAHTDFILAIIGEELGLVGVLAVLTAFGILIYRGFSASLRARDLFGSYLAFGITTLLAMQALLNMGVVFGLLPTKGLALPFISYGGTSLIMSLFMAGVVANISARHPEPRPRPLFRLWRGPRQGPGKNRRAEKGPTIVVDPPAPLWARKAGGLAAGAAAAAMADELMADLPGRGGSARGGAMDPDDFAGVEAANGNGANANVLNADETLDERIADVGDEDFDEVDEDLDDEREADAGRGSRTPSRKGR